MSNPFDYSRDRFDPELTEHLALPILRQFYNNWFRVAVNGIDNLPEQGPVLLVANHSGTIAMDAAMLMVAVHDEPEQPRHLRLLGADFMLNRPVIGQAVRRFGATLANQKDALDLVQRGEAIGVFPEGTKGTGKPFTDRYQLQRFGRGGFAALALQTGTPIIPVSIVGAEEIYPLIGDMPRLARSLRIPYFPVTPTFPFLGPLGMVPLPTKWVIEFGKPIETAGAEYDAHSARDVFALADEVKRTIQSTLDALVEQRGSIFGD